MRYLALQVGRPAIRENLDVVRVRRRRAFGWEFWVAETVWAALIGVSWLVGWSTTAGEVLLGVAVWLGVIPPVWYFRLARRRTAPLSDPTENEGIRIIRR